MKLRKSGSFPLMMPSEATPTRRDKSDFNILVGPMSPVETDDSGALSSMCLGKDEQMHAPLCVPLGTLVKPEAQTPFNF